MRRRPKSQKNYQKLYFWGSRSCKVIDVNKSKKPLTSACYDMQQVCRPTTYLQPFSHYKSQHQQKCLFRGKGTPLWRPRSRKTPLTHRHNFLSQKTRDLVVAHIKDFVILACTVLIQSKSVTDGQTDGQTPRRWPRRVKLSRVKTPSRSILHTADYIGESI